MEREEKLLSLLNGLDSSFQATFQELVKEICFLEGQLKELKQYPFIVVHPDNPAKQKTTPAAKQYKEFLQQYNNCIKTMLRTLERNEVEEESPLALYLKSMRESMNHE